MKNIQKPKKPHQTALQSNSVTPEELQQRKDKLNQLKELDIDTTIIDDSIEEENIDKLKASVLIMQGKEVPAELKQRILEKSNKQQSM
jgi:histidinol phosphatase-like PHP family hydrolase